MALEILSLAGRSALGSTLTTGTALLLPVAVSGLVVGFVAVFSAGGTSAILVAAVVRVPAAAALLAAAVRAFGELAAAVRAATVAPNRDATAATSGFRTASVSSSAVFVSGEAPGGSVLGAAVAAFTEPPAAEKAAIPRGSHPFLCLVAVPGGTQLLLTHLLGGLRQNGLQ